MTTWLIEISYYGRDPWEETIFPECNTSQEALEVIDQELSNGLPCSALRLRARNVDTDEVVSPE